MLKSLYLYSRAVSHSQSTEGIWGVYEESLSPPALNQPLIGVARVGGSLLYCDLLLHCLPVSRGVREKEFAKALATYLIWEGVGQVGNR